MSKSKICYMSPHQRLDELRVEAGMRQLVAADSSRRVITRWLAGLELSITLLAHCKQSNPCHLPYVEFISLPTSLQVPSALDFGFTPTKETVTALLVVKNSGDVRVSARWSV